MIVKLFPFRLDNNASSGGGWMENRSAVCRHRMVVLLTSGNVQCHTEDGSEVLPERDIFSFYRNDRCDNVPPDRSRSISLMQPMMQITM